MKYFAHRMQQQQQQQRQRCIVMNMVEMDAVRDCMANGILRRRVLQFAAVVVCNICVWLLRRLYSYSCDMAFTHIRSGRGAQSRDGTTKAKRICIDTSTVSESRQSAASSCDGTAYDISSFVHCAIFCNVHECIIIFAICSVVHSIALRRISSFTINSLI